MNEGNQLANLKELTVIEGIAWAIDVCTIVYENGDSLNQLGLPNEWEPIRYRVYRHTKNTRFVPNVMATSKDRSIRRSD
jgi:hypothetical protein